MHVINYHCNDMSKSSIKLQLLRKVQLIPVNYNYHNHNTGLQLRMYTIISVGNAVMLSLLNCKHSICENVSL